MGCQRIGLAVAGSTRSVTTEPSQLISVNAYGDAVAIRRSGEEKTEFFLGLDCFAHAFEVDGRSYTEPLSGLILKYAIEGLMKAG